MYSANVLWDFRVVALCSVVGAQIEETLYDTTLDKCFATWVNSHALSCLNIICTYSNLRKMTKRTIWSLLMAMYSLSLTPEIFFTSTTTCQKCEASFCFIEAKWLAFTGCIYGHGPPS